MRNILLAMALLSAAACGGKPKSAESYSTRADISQDAFQRGMKALDEERYTEAARIFEKILVDTPAEEYDFVVMYNLGAAHEGLKNCKSAAETYKSVAKGSAGKFPRLEVLALLRLSYAYECLGQNEKVIVALMDVRRRVKHLPEDVAKSEVPARLAAAYARMGNRKEAEKYFRQALQGVKFLQVKYKDSIVLADRLSESLYFMGRSHVSENEFLRNPVAQVKGLELMQLYLLQAAELGSAKWSGRAVNEILGNYTRVWNFLEKLDAPENSDPSLRVRERDKLRSDVLRETLRSVRVLKAQRIPDRQESVPVAQLFQGLEREERKLTAMINEIGPYTDLTPQAADREGLKRPGKVRASQKSPLEKNQGQSP